ncbi:hypothetical protein N8A90_09225 [Variovorax sp. N23]|nr:hypothetical protein [Variovorax sp. N23]
MFNGSTVASQDAARWYELTDQYAAAVVAVQRGDAAARVRMLAMYAELKRFAQSQGQPFPRGIGT